MSEFLSIPVAMPAWQTSLEIPLVPAEFMPQRALEIHLTSKVVRRAYARAVRAQQRAYAFAREFLRKSKPNPKPEEAKKIPLLVDAPRVVIDMYSCLRNQEIQTWNALAKVAGLPKLPSLRRRGRRRLLVDFGPEPRTLTAILPMPLAGPIGSRRRESIMDFEMFDTSLSSGEPTLPKPPLAWPSPPRPRSEVMYDREPWPARNSGPR